MAVIAAWSLEHFGEQAAERYKILLGQAFADLKDNPERSGTAARPELYADARTYHISFSRYRVAAPRVQKPRHLLLYRVRQNTIEVARVLHDSSDLKQHVPAGI